MPVSILQQHLCRVLVVVAVLLLGLSLERCSHLAPENLVPCVVVVLLAESEFDAFSSLELFVLDFVGGFF